MTFSLKIINFPFGTNEKFIIFRCAIFPNGKFIVFKRPNIWANYSLIIMCSNIGTPNNHHFPSGTNGKVMLLGVPILKHFRVSAQLATALLKSAEGKTKERG